MAPRIGLIIGSARNPRIGAQVADFVLQTIQANTSSSSNPKATFERIDLAKWNLPMLDEPQPAVLISDPVNYVHEHTRAWSREISSYDGFVFVSPEYNCKLEEPTASKTSLVLT
jgi:NAD(P)H-dependent FMN reductase